MWAEPKHPVTKPLFPSSTTVCDLGCCVCLLGGDRTAASVSCPDTVSANFVTRTINTTVVHNHVRLNLRTSAVRGGAGFDLNTHGRHAWFGDTHESERERTILVDVELRDPIQKIDMDTGGNRQVKHIWQMMESLSLW